MGVSVHYVGFDIHKKTVAFCVKTKSGTIREEGVIPATRRALAACAENRRPWIGAMEATLFSGWIYDELKPHARELKVAHPAMLKAIGASKKKNDRVDASTIADLLRANLLPACHMASKRTRELRRVLRYRRLVVNEATRMKNKISGLLMEVGAEYDKKKLHGRRYFSTLLAEGAYVSDSILDLLSTSRAALEMFESVERRLVGALIRDPVLNERVERLMTIDGVGEVTALCWALEIGDVSRFRSLGDVISYCGLCSAQNSSAGQDKRGPISKKRNKHLQSVLIEAAKLAPRWNPALRALHDRELKRGNRNRATMAVERKLAAYLLAVDRSGKPYELRLPAAA